MIGYALCKHIYIYSYIYCICTYSSSSVFYLSLPTLRMGSLREAWAGRVCRSYSMGIGSAERIDLINQKE